MRHVMCNGDLWMDRSGGGEWGWSMWGMLSLDDFFSSFPQHDEVYIFNYLTKCPSSTTSLEKRIHCVYEFIN